MFGTLKPKRCGLGPAEQGSHKAMYCGLCQSLGQHHGQAMRPLVSFDAVFLALVADGLSEQPAAPSQTRCPMVPVVHRPTVDPNSDAMRFATHVSVLLAEQRLADKAEEGHWLGLARPLLSGSGTRARGALRELGVDLGGLEGFERHQSEAERDPGVTPEGASKPTEEALAEVLGRIADLPSVAQQARSDLRRLGAATGRIIYFVDALEDLRKDLRRGDFNPCLDPATRRLDPHRRARVVSLLEGALDEAASALAALPWKRHRALAANIVAVEQRRRAKAAVEGALSLSPSPRFDLRALLMRPLLVAWVWWWIAGPARAEEPSKAPEPAPAPAPPAPEAPKSLWEELVALWQALLDACEAFCTALAEGCQACAEGCDDCSSCGSECSSCGDECSRSCDGCGTTCNDCGNCCNGCSTGCNDCGRSCDSCGDGCNDCGKGCNDCGNCCNGCNDCGKGCNDCNC